MNMDVNLVVVAGRIAAPPELRAFESGARCLRYLVTTTSELPTHRVDVLAITLWDPDDGLVEEPGTPGERVWIVAGVRRRFLDSDGRRQSRLELEAHSVQVGEPVRVGDEADT